MLLTCFSLAKCRWSLIAGRLPGRTDNEIKNYWNTHIRRKLLNRGIDPVTHRPVNDPSPRVEGDTTISFTATTKALPADQLEQKRSTVSGFEVSAEIANRCPDLNLELRISPPNLNQEPSVSCFSCSLGLKNSTDCSCGRITGGSSGGRDGGCDFLRLKSGVLDYRSLEMK